MVFSNLKLLNRAYSDNFKEVNLDGFEIVY